MTAAFVVTRWNGRIHIAVDHICAPPIGEAPLGSELKRIPLSDGGAQSPLALLAYAFGPEIREAEGRAA